MNRAWRIHVGALAAYVVVALVLSWPLPTRLGTHLTGAPDGDTGVYVWNQWVFHHELVEHRTTPYFTGTIFSMTRRADLSLHNYTTFANVLALPLIEPLGIVATFNIIYLLMSVLTAYATFLLARALMPDAAIESWLAGVLFAWSPTMVTRGMGHFSLVAAAPLPIFLLLLLRAHRYQRLRDAAALGLAAAVAALSDVYYAVFCLMIAAGYVGSQVLHVRRVHRRGGAGVAPTRAVLMAMDVLIVSMLAFAAAIAVRGGWSFTLLGRPVSMRGLYTPMLVATVLTIVRLAWPYRPSLVHLRADEVWRTIRLAACTGLVAAVVLSPVLYAVSIRIIEGRFENPRVFWRSSPMGVDALSFIVPNPNHPLAPGTFRQWLTPGRPDAYLENVASLPLVALGVLLLAWKRGWRPPRGWIVLGAAFGLLALGPFLHVGHINTYVPGPWAFLRYVPIIGLARTPSRFTMIVLLALAVLFAMGVHYLAGNSQRRRRVLLIVGALLCVELLPVPRPLYSATFPRIYDRIAADPRPDIRVLELPFGVRDGASSVGNFTARSQFFQTRHEKMLIGGYLSRVSRLRIAEIRRDAMLDGLISLSEGAPMSAEQRQPLMAAGPDFVTRAQIGYVIIDRQRTPPQLAEFAVQAFHLERLDSDAGLDLYIPGPGGT